MSASVLLATPAYGGQVTVGYVQSLLALKDACVARGLSLEIDLAPGDALITRARSRIATRFLEHTQHTHLLFVDADVAFEPDHLFRLIAADRPVVGGVYPLKQIHWEKVEGAAKAGLKDVQAASLAYVVRFLPTPDHSVELDDAGFGAVAFLATGFMLIRRDALERIAAAHPELRCQVARTAAAPEPVTMFFESMVDPDTGEHLSEDFAFCRRWRGLGGEVVADFRTRMSHIGHATYTGSLMDAVAR
jgi:hypothetical protein